MKLLRLLRLIFSPMKEIAKQLKRLADLYEEDLGSRNPPVLLRLEKPDPRWDTSVEYTGVSEDVPVWKRFSPFSHPEEEPDEGE